LGGGGGMVMENGGVAAVIARNEAIQKATISACFWIASFLAMTGAGAPASDAN